MKQVLLIICLLFCFLLTSAQSIETNGSYYIEPYKLSFDYVKTLSNRADFFLVSGNYDKAISLGEEKVAILRRIYGEDNVEYALSLSELAFYNYNKGEYRKAVCQALKAVKILENKDMQESVLYAIVTNQLSYFLGNKSEKKTALQYRQNAIKILEKNNGKGYINEIENSEPSNIYTEYSNTKEALLFKRAYNEYVELQYDSIDYAMNLFWKETYPSSERKDYLEAIRTLKETLRLLHKWAGDYYDKYVSSLLLLSIYYEDVGNYEDCYQICEKHANLTKKYCGEYSSEYAQSISNYAFGLFKGGEYVKAIDKEQKAMEICVSINDSLQYAFSLSNMGIYHNRIGSLDKAIDYNKEALPILESHHQSIAYANTLSDLSDIYCKKGEYEYAIILANKAIALVAFQSKDYYRFLANLANCYFYANEYKKAINLLEESCKYMDQSNIEDLSLSSNYENLALFYSKVGRLRDAIWSQEKSIEIQRKWISKDNILTANSLSFLGHLYVTLGDISKGIQLEEKAAKIISDVEGEENLDYVNVLRHLSIAYYQNYKKMLNFLEKAKAIIEKYDLGGPSVLINIYGELAYSYAGIGKVDKVKEIEKIIRNNKSAQSYFMKNEDDYADYRHTISKCYSLLGDYTKSMEIEERVLEYYKNKYKEDISKYDDVILNMVMNYARLYDTTNLLKILKETNLLDYHKDELLSNITSLSFKRRNDYWTFLQRTFIDAIPLLASITGDEYVISRAYDYSALFAKNILLKTEMEMSELIDRHADNQLKEDYNNYLLNKSKLCLVFDKNEEDSLINLINYQEDIIRQKLNNQGLLHQIKYSWKDIQSKMDRNDIAIEFLCFDSGEYGQFISALLLKRDYKSPKLINICPSDTIKFYYQNNQMDSLYRYIWGSIEKELEDIDNIYFSPAGPIYNCPIEYLQNREKLYMFEKYNIYRVSSTQKILNKCINKSYKTSVLFGGLDYDYENANDRDTQNHQHISIDRGLREIMINRNGFDKLVNTGVEISEISKILSQSNISCKAFTGIDGSEETFKKLSGQSLDIMHMSTHGMYIETNMADDQRIANNFIFVKDDNSPIQYEDAALSRSFLVMSKGNMLSKHKTIPDGMEDGILTAQEIAGMDFNGLDLVVLSACQTALGDIDNEGVYGLQRGFKKAGANTILMSLDKVDDEATKILMVEFYKNLVSGKTKHQSLKDAQKYLRQVDNGKYDKPEYWASFIMLDGLN